jgi:hypothetical protein
MLFNDFLVKGDVPGNKQKVQPKFPLNCFTLKQSAFAGKSAKNP